MLVPTTTKEFPLCVGWPLGVPMLEGHAKLSYAMGTCMTKGL